MGGCPAQFSGALQEIGSKVGSGGGDGDGNHYTGNDFGGVASG